MIGETKILVQIIRTIYHSEIHTHHSILYFRGCTVQSFYNTFNDTVNVKAAKFVHFLRIFGLVSVDIYFGVRSGNAAPTSR